MEAGGRFKIRSNGIPADPAMLKHKYSQHFNLFVCPWSLSYVLCLLFTC